MSPVLCPACGTEIDAELGPDRIDCICGSRLAIKHGAAGETIVELVAEPMFFQDQHFGDAVPAEDKKAFAESAEAVAREWLAEYTDDNPRVIPKTHACEVAMICAALLYRSTQACRCTPDGGFVCTPCKDRGVDKLRAVRAYVEDELATAIGTRRATLEDLHAILAEE